ncbi:MAG: hypothetical protein NVS4B12_17180 [Ktedonobacteraceae bacterium]
MQFAWLILIPVTLGNILVTGIVYLVISSFGLPTWVFLTVIAAINWAALFGFIRLVGRVTVSSARRAQSPSIRARQRVNTVPSPALPLRTAVPARVALPQGGNAATVTTISSRE